jgi:transcriptional regulator with XRE-family HTH domain
VNTSISFSEWLLATLEEKEWSQARLAKAAQISPASISDILSGRRKIGKDLATAIANALKLPPEQVFRAAGILPPEKDEDPWVEEMSHKLSQMSPGLRTVAERLINSMVEGEEADRRKAKQKKTKTSTP